jgi:hypothetical protein
MKRLLITDIDTPLGMELLVRFLKQGDEVIAVQSSKETGFKIPKLPSKPLAVIYWKKSSSLSTLNLIIKCKSTTNFLDGALLVNILPGEQSSITELSMSAIEHVIDNWIKGSLFFIKDFLDYFAKINNGMLSVITSLPETNKNSSLFTASFYSYFENLLSTLTRMYKHQDIGIHGFFIKQLKQDSSADAIVKNINEKCYKPGGKLFHL